MIWFENVYKDIKKSENQSILVNGELETTESIQKLFIKIMALHKSYGHNPPLSLRRSCIVILHEDYYNGKQYPVDLDIKKIYLKANSRFEILNRNTKDLKFAHKIHPKNPCLFFEENTRRMAAYRKALEILVLHSKNYFDKQEAVPSFHLLYQDIILC